MRDLVVSDLADLLSGECRNGDGLSIERGELDFVAATLVMYEDNGANVASGKTMGRQIALQNNLVELIDHGVRLSGCAVANLGTDSPFLINQTLRTFKDVPSGAGSAPSTT
jgi:hypothetical protein